MRDSSTRISPRQTRSLPVSAVAAVLAIGMTAAYLRRTRRTSSHRAGAVVRRSEWTRGGRPSGLARPSGLQAVPDFIEVGPDQYKQASAASDAEVETAMRRLLKQAAVHAEEAASNAGTAGAYGTLTTVEPELVARADALKAEAEALQVYLDSRPGRS